MAFVDAGGFRLHYLLEGDPERPAVLLSNSLGANLSMWDAQMDALLKEFRVLRYDTRGHGKSEMPDGPSTLAALGQDVVALLDVVGLDSAHVCGISLGGLTAMWVGLHAKDRVRSLVLSNTAAKIGAAAAWNERIAAVKEHGLVSIADTVISRWFTPAFRNNAELFAAQKAMFLGCSPEGYTSASAAIRDSDLRPEICAVRARTLVISGADDVVTPPTDGQALAAAIPGGVFRQVPGAHLANIEQPEAYNKVLLSFLKNEQTQWRHSMDDEQRRHDGMMVRRAVLGDAHVDRAAAHATDPLQADFQDLITRYAWGEIWSRPGLPRHTRSLLTIAMMAALNRSEELRLHLRAAVNNGVSRPEITEVLLQCAIYCGVPAANTAFHHASDVFAAIDAEAAETKQNAAGAQAGSLT